MKIISRIFLTIALITILFAETLLMTACGKYNVETENFDMPTISASTYDNASFCDYTTSEQITTENLPEQWENYGVGDPFVMRYNGMYYLYCSTRDRKVGVRGWKSADLIHWSQCTGTGLETGYVSDDENTKSAYAPEVYYFNGVFYMYTSPSGNGHIILTSTSPEGPFTVVKEEGSSDARIDVNKIDGTVFIDDDESMYFLNAGDGGIQMRSMSSMTEISSVATKLSNANIGGWTEGPMLIKNNGIYYLTYTGTNVLSQAYRVNYSAETEQSMLGKRTSFAQGANSSLILTVDEANNFKGLGHSSTVLGPDMDSYYLAYHSLNSVTTNGPYRSFNIDRIIFNGTQMSVDESKTNSISASMPTFSANTNAEDKFDNVSGKIISNISTGKVFTAEYNFTGANTKCIFSYTNERNYAYVSVNFAGKTVDVYNVVNGTESKLTSGTLVNNFSSSVLHTIRVAYADGKIDVYFDNLKKIDGYSYQFNAGKIGYANAESISYTAFSSVARGTSDKTELKQSGCNIGASTYLPEGYFDGITSYKLSDKSSLSLLNFTDDDYYNDIKYTGAYQLELGSNSDFARYLVYFRDSDHYGLRLTYQSKYAGKKIGIQIGNGDVNVVTLPSVSVQEGSTMITSIIYEVNVNSGANLVTFYGVDNAVGFVDFGFEATAYGGYEFSNSLSQVVTNGATYSTMYSLSDGGHTAREGSLNLVYFGRDNLFNFQAEVSMKFNSLNYYSAGIMMRARNFANSAKDNSTSIQGYYIAIDSMNISLSKFDHGSSQTNICVKSHGISSSELTGKYLTLKAQIKGNTLTVYLNGKEMFAYTDAQAFLTGYFGLYSDGAEAVYKNLKIKQI